MSARSYLYARLYRRKKPRLVARAKRVRYVTPYTRPRGSAAAGGHLPIEIREMIRGAPTTTERFIGLIAGARDVVWENGAWVSYKGYLPDKEIVYPRAEGRHVLRNILHWREGGPYGGQEVWFSPTSSPGVHYSGASEITALTDYVDSLEQGARRTRYAAVIDQDAERPYLWRVSRPTGGSARVFSYIRPSELVALLNRRYNYVDASTATKRKYKIYGE
jgi:hypothetical protein